MGPGLALFVGRGFAPPTVGCMETSPTRFDAATSDQSRLRTAFRIGVGVAVAGVLAEVVTVLIPAASAAGSSGRSWGWLDLLVGSFPACLFVGIGAAQAVCCRRAPGVLAGAAGAPSEAVAAASPCKRTMCVGPDLEGVQLYFAGPGPEIGDPGTLYRRGEVAAFVTDTGTYWSV